MAPRVLLVGEIGMRLEVDFIGAGLACTVAPTAAAGVGWMRQSPFPIVVVPASLPDMTGPMFARGLLQHFPDVIVLMYGGVIDEHLEPFVKDGRVVPVPEQTSISSVADYLRRRVASAAAAAAAPDATAAASVPTLAPLGPAPASDVAGSTTLSPKLVPVGDALPRAKTTAPVPVVMLQADDDADEQAKQAAQHIVDLQARIGAAEWALGKEKQARADVDRALFESKEQLNAAQQALQQAALGGGAQGSAAKAAADAIMRERDEAQLARDNAQRERDAIAAGRDAIAAERDRVAAERDELRAHSGPTQSALDEARAALQTLELDHDDLRKRAGAAAGQQSMLQAQLDDERIAHGQTRAERDRALGDTDRLRSDLVEFHTALTAANEAKTRAIADAATAKADYAEVRTQRDELTALLDGERRGRAADMDAHKVAVATLDVKLANHAEALRRVAVDLKTQMDETKSAKAESDAAKNRIQELEDALSKAKESAQAAFEGNKLTDHDKRKLEARTTEMARDVDEARRKAEEAREEMFQARQLRDDAEIHAADLENQIVDLRSALETTRSELATAQAKVAALATQVEELRTSGGRNNAELQLLEGRLDSVTRERDRALSALTDASRKLMELEDERQQAS